MTPVAKANYNRLMGGVVIQKSARSKVSVEEKENKQASRDFKVKNTFGQPNGKTTRQRPRLKGGPGSSILDGKERLLTKVLHIPVGQLNI